MNKRFWALCVALALAAPAARAVDLCDGPCSIAIDFAAGGSIGAADGATLTFGPEGGALALGDGGSMTLGEGGSVAKAEGDPDDMSQGGTLTLGPGGSIQFGRGGSLATGAAGGVTSPGQLRIDSASTIAIESPQAVHLGDLESHGQVEMTTQGAVDGCDPGNPVPIAMIEGDTETLLTVVAGGDISMGSFAGHPEIYVTAQDDITLCVAEGAFEPAPGSGDAGSGGASGSITLDTSGGANCTGCDPGWILLDAGTGNPPIDVDVGALERGGGGAMGAWLLLGLMAMGRRRR